MLRHLQVGFDEGAVDEQLRFDLGKLGFLPAFDLLPQAIEVALHFVNADGERVLQREVFGMLGQDRLERAWDNASDLPVSG
jgi:hypothetical protein